MTRRPEASAADPVRLAALDAYGVLDTPAEPGFDHVVLLARTLCAAPIALITLVAGDRQFFKARSGLPGCGGGLDASICMHLLDRRDLLVIPDLTRDARTYANPVVTGEPHLRFYAGVPLVDRDGHALGALCVIDTEPRPDGLSEERGECLAALADLVMIQFEMRRTLAKEVGVPSGTEEASERR